MNDVRCPPADQPVTMIIRLNPNNVRALNDRGLSYERKGYYDRAIADYSEVIRLVKGSSLSRTAIGALPTKKKAS